MKTISPIVEGELDDILAQKLIQAAGHQYSGISYGRRGVGYIRNKIRDFNSSARNICYLALVDLMDTGHPCPSLLVAEWLPTRNNGMLFRIVVREIESWIMADREGLSQFLKVAIRHIPEAPENEDDPKQALVNAARYSTSRKIRNAIVPNPHTRALVGPLYNSELATFIQNGWSLERARTRSRSLQKCLDRLASFNAAGNAVE